MQELIWYKDVASFITKDNFLTVIPSKNQTYAGQLNSLLRLSLYYSVIVSLIKQHIEYLIIPVLVAGVIYLLYDNFRTVGMETLSVKEQNSKCIKPSKQNPFMNLLNSDKRTRKPACDPLNDETKSDINEKFNRSIFKDIDDVWERNNAGRNFYTMPSTTVPNDQTGFAEWLYSGTRAGGKQIRPPRNAINTM